MGLLLQRLVLEQQLNCERQHYFCSIQQYKSKKKNKNKLKSATRLRFSM